MIRIQNIYYMLAYAFEILREQGYEKCATEPFEHTADLLSAILARGITVQIKRGLNRAYLEKTEPLSGLRGKINVTESVKRQTLSRRQLICTYDEYSLNSYPNRIIKTTVALLLRHDIPQARKKELRRLMRYFQEVEVLPPAAIDWHIQYHRHNQTYRMLISVCYLVIKGLLQTTSDGTVNLMAFLDEQRMCRLYEKFILAYYRREYPQLKARAAQIHWALDDGISTMLPIMRSDITLFYQGRTLIIEAKYYSHTTQERYGVHKLHSDNLYQLFTYVKNKAADGGAVAGLLLYAKTDETAPLNQPFQMSGNTIGVKTLDLNCEFSQIAGQLNEIAEKFMSDETP